MNNFNMKAIIGAVVLFGVLPIFAATNSPVAIEGAFGVKLGEPLPAARTGPSRTNDALVWTHFVPSAPIPELSTDAYKVKTTLANSRVGQIAIRDYPVTGRLTLELGDRLRTQLTEKYGAPAETEMIGNMGTIKWVQAQRSISLFWVASEGTNSIIALNYLDEPLCAAAVREQNVAEKSGGL